MIVIRSGSSVFTVGKLFGNNIDIVEGHLAFMGQSKVHYALDFRMDSLV